MVIQTGYRSRINAAGLYKRITIMRKVCLLCLFVILGVADAGCAKQQSAEGVTPTTIVESTVAPTTLTATLEP
ncbi:MAG: hypothetical protein J6J42_10185, partial [Lachnospiraceae bacterium]|nr:hypothetical protein [Lachnospiraceae bacterium]